MRLNFGSNIYQKIILNKIHSKKKIKLILYLLMNKMSTKKNKNLLKKYKP